MKSTHLIQAFLMASLLLTGCASSPPARFYSINSGITPAPANTAATTTIAIAPVTVPEMVDRPQIVTRSARNEINFSEFARWAEPLKQATARAIGDQLAQQIPGATVFTYPQGANVDAQYQLLIEVSRFDAVLGESLTLEALWTLKSSAAQKPQTGRSVVNEPLQGDKSYDALAAATGRAMASLSREIAAAIQRGQ